ncbi:cupin domain-containing protein [Desulfotomaculum copahuensis]|uniref:Cupin n=1 Tax=Desulfotomaculum copahuensis TaxID=1838280 RepID=A0A1B7LH34_9FIRM|nr:cupin domain-containing protein [Desulfotomaculum copahuensis]OAT85479.1 cupin [Desulfotomaculum copahuensis]
MEQNKGHSGTNVPAAKVLALPGLLNYQEGAVVSRTVIDQKTGTVTLFAFDEGQGLSEHTAPYDAMVYLLDGEAEVTIAGQPLHLKTGEMVIMPANQPHALRAIRKFKMLLIMIRYAM